MTSHTSLYQYSLLYRPKINMQMYNEKPVAEN